MTGQQDEIAHLQELLKIQHRNRRRLEETTAKHGLDIPTPLANELADTRAEIIHLEEQLALLTPPPVHPSSLSPHPSAFPPNPFGDQGRLTDPSRFFDREELLRQIFEELDKGGNLSLVGESQVGKSSLLSIICAQAPAQLGRPAAYLSLEWVDNEDDFYQALCETLGLEEPCRGFKLTRALRDKKYLLGLDEIEKMTWDGFTRNLRSHLRGLADGHDAPLKLVIASRSPLARLFPDSPELDSPLAGICRQLDVKPFSPDQARAFITHRLQQATGVTFTPAEIDALLAQTQGHPARLQRAAADLFDKKRGSL